MRWGAVLCTCNETLPWDVRAVQRGLELPSPPVLCHRLPRDQIHRLIELLGRGDVDRVLVGCCGGDALFGQAARAAGAAPDAVTVVNPREGSFRVHGDRAAANAKAIRLLRAGMQRVAPTPAPLPVKVAPTVLIATDSPPGLALAGRLASVAEPIVVLDERSAGFDRVPARPLPWKANWGRVTGIAGTLGAFRVTVERTQPLDLGACILCRRCVPVCHTSAITDGLRLRTERCDRCGDCLTACGQINAIRIPRSEREVIEAGQVVIIGDPVPAGPTRTGLHRAGSEDAAVEALAWRIAGLIGTFEKPSYVRYDPDTCAGGAAGRRGCDRCVPACPYGAIARAPGNALRIAVDVRACEGCGACVAVCPTSSLTFTEPSPAETHARLAALLRPIAGDPLRPVVAFHCGEDGAAALAEAGRTGRRYPASVVPVPMACLRQVDEADILQALRMGAGAVALVGCSTCPHGERARLEDRVAFTRTVLQAFGVEAERVGVLTGDAIFPGLEALSSLDGAPPASGASDGQARTGRERVAGALRALIASTGREPGAVPAPASMAYATPAVRASGCTLCRTCVNVCPTHAFRFREETAALELRAISCVDCGLCAAACPETVITLPHEISLTGAALEYRTVAQDEPLACTTCGTPFGNRRAVEAVESRIAGLAQLADAFAGARKQLLRMCPKCRAVAAVMEMQKGWEP